MHDQLCNVISYFACSCDIGKICVHNNIVHHLTKHQYYCSDSLAFATEPVLGSLANLLGALERLPLNCQQELKVDDLQLSHLAVRVFFRLSVDVGDFLELLFLRNKLSGALLFIM